MMQSLLELPLSGKSYQEVIGNRMICTAPVFSVRQENETGFTGKETRAFEVNKFLGMFTAQKRL